MSRSIPLALAVAVVVLVPSNSAALGASQATSGCSGGNGTSTQTTASYRFVLRLGMPEKMYTQAQVKKLHPKSGEVMMGGSMGMAGMTMGASKGSRHLEVKICSRKTGAVITDAQPTITLSDTMGMATQVPVAKMRGMHAGMDDMHYGNNVKMSANQKLAVKVTLKGETAVFHVRAPMRM